MRRPAVRIGSTHEDRQGEQYDKAFYETLLKSVPPRSPLYRNHDPSLPCIGWLCDYRLIPDPDAPGHWLLVADLEVINEADAEEAVRLAPFFSWSATVHIRSNTGTPLIGVFLPYPHYRDDGIVEAVLSWDAPLQVGGMVRKAVDPVTVALIVGPTITAAGGFLLAPVWRRVYEDDVHPLVKPLIQKIKAHLGLPCDYMQKLRGPSGRTTEVWLRPSRTSEDTLDPVYMAPVLDSVARLVAERWSDELCHVKRVRCAFDELNMKYVVVSVEYIDGEVMTPSQAEQ